VFLADDAVADHAVALAREGRAMLLAVLADAARSRALEVTALIDDSVPFDLPVRGARAAVPSGEEIGCLQEAAAACDVAIIIAPETAGILAGRVAAARAVGAEVIAPDAAWLALAADKQATVLALAAAGVPVPPGRALDVGAAWPQGFVRPAVRKRLDGCGCDGFTVVEPHDSPPHAAEHAARIEAAAAGRSAGVACLCGAGGVVPLPPLEQRFTTGPEPAYRGGSVIDDPGLESRAAGLACRAVAALERAAGCAARGWIGVDLVLGVREDGRDDRVLEVNPRLTTSFVGHSHGRDHSLIEWVIRMARGTAPPGVRPPHHAPAAFEVERVAPVVPG
jgi:predicted ATP-grasp superfamily ATP-dependent carboligase